MTALLEKGDLRNPEIHTAKLGEAAEALATVGSGHVRGKLVVIPR